MGPALANGSLWVLRLTASVAADHPRNGTQDVNANRKFYEDKIYPRLHNRTRALLVPYIAASGCDATDLARRDRPGHATPGNLSSQCGFPMGYALPPAYNVSVNCSIHAQEEQNLVRMRGFFEWAKQDDRVAGLIPCELTVPTLASCRLSDASRCAVAFRALLQFVGASHSAALQRLQARGSRAAAAAQAAEADWHVHQEGRCAVRPSQCE